VTEPTVVLEAPKPRFRGRLHQIAFFASIPQGIAALVAGAGWVSRLAAGIYALSMSGLFAVSSAYHRLRWTPRGLSRIRKADHAMIFVLIAGSYTPFGLLVLHGVWAITLLAVVWAGAVFGIGIKVFRMERSSTIGGALYIILGWAAIVALPKLVTSLSPVNLALVFTGGLLYTGGAVILLLRRPNPRPAVFGYHEIWHAMVVAASLCHYTAIMLLLTGL
jgi:hemolysin III